MITELVVSNYRSLGPEVTMRPKGLTILIGPNGSGKSNLLDVLTFVRDAVLQGLPAAITHRGGIDSVRRRSQGHPYNVRVSLSIESADGPGSFGFELTGDTDEEYRVKSEWAEARHGGGHFSYQRDGQRWEGPPGIAPRLDEQSLAINSLGGDERFKALVDYLSTLTVYSIFPDTLRQPQKFDAERPMKRHGENWVAVLRDMVKKKDAKDELVMGVRKLTGDIEDVRVSSAAGYLIAEFKYAGTGKGRSKRWFEAGQQSDGTLRVAGLLTALLQSPPLPVIGVEEPELTVHPGALPMLHDYLRQASEQSQILVTTHSPLILDVVDVDRTALFVVDRSSGTTVVRQVTGEQLEPVRKKLFSLGDLYLTGELQTSFALPSDDSTP